MNSPTSKTESPSTSLSVPTFVTESAGAGSTGYRFSAVVDRAAPRGSNPWKTTKLYTSPLSTSAWVGTCVARQDISSPGLRIVVGQDSSGVSSSKISRKSTGTLPVLVRMMS